jgi:hypothetical protein
MAELKTQTKNKKKPSKKKVSPKYKFVNTKSFIGFIDR